MRLRRNIRSSCTATRGPSIVRNDRSKRYCKVLLAALATLLAGTVFVGTANAQMVQLQVDVESIEENAGETTIKVTGELLCSATSNIPVVVTVGSDDDTATNETDYNTSVLSFTLTISEGDIAATSTFVLTPIDDELVEGDEALSLSGTVSSDNVDDDKPVEGHEASSLSCTVSSDKKVKGATITIEDNESTLVTLTADRPSVHEADGPVTVTVTGTLNQAPRSTETVVTVSVGMPSDSATEGTDYGTIDDFAMTIAADETTGTAFFTFTPTEDELDEDDEAISLSGTTTAEDLSVDGTTLEITDDDTRGLEVLLSTPTVVEDQRYIYTVRLNSEPAGEVTVTPRSDNRYIEFDREALVFDQNDWRARKEIAFVIGSENQQTSLTIEHSVSGYGEVTEGGVVTVIVAQSPVSLEQQTVHRTVAAVAAATVSNVTSNIGARFSAPTGGATLNFAGTRVAFGPTDTKSLESIGLPDSFDDRNGDSWQGQHRTMTGSELLRSSSLEIALGASQGDKDPMLDASKRLTVWGRGDFQFFESGGGRKSGYDGNLLAGYLGADLAMDGGWLFGLAVSRIIAEADYTLGGAGTGGTLEAELTNVHPYVRLAVGERAELWTILGLGTGEVSNTTQQGESTSDLSMRMLSAGGRQGLVTVGGVDLAILADGSSATVETDDGVESIDGISADVWRVRIGAEASYTIGWDDGSALTSFLEVAGRRDGGDSAQGDGLEVSPGLAFNDPESGFAVEARGRMLVLHSADNHREYGASITASLAPGAGGHGLSMAITPTWGTLDSSLGARGANLFPARAADRRSESVSLSSRFAYGLNAGTGVMAPFIDFSLRDGDSHRIRIGSRFSPSPSVDLELTGDRHQDASETAEHGVQFSARIRF